MGASFEEYRKEYLEDTPWRGSVNAKLDASDPYRFFLTRIKDCRSTYDEDLSITFPGITLCYLISILLPQKFSGFTVRKLNVYNFSEIGMKYF